MTFAESVSAYLERGRPEVLAAAFGVAPSTVDRWAKGIARPHPKLQEQVLQWLAARPLGESKQVLLCNSCGGRDETECNCWWKL